ncbi:MAG: 3-deoxy-D-manno-octulosonic acid transferase [Verrucomicrobiales bacterium]
MRFIALTLYRLFYPLAFLLMLPAQWRKMRRRGGYGERAGERFARYDEATLGRFADGCWWVHAVSVGEMIMALKLIQTLRETGTWTGQVALTTTTSTGRKLALERADTKTTVLWTPLDFPWVARRAIDLLMPRRIILVEAEVWPNLLARAHRSGIPVAIVNARLSARSEKRYRFFRPIIAPIFSMLDRVCVQDEADRGRFAALGIDPERITVTGAIKFDDEAASAAIPALEAARVALARFPKLAGKPFLLAASTHSGEETIIAQAWLETRKAFPDLAFVAVPRHFERGAEVAADLTALGLNPARRSLPLGPDDAAADCLVADSTGELRAWVELSTLVVVGKSFLNHSGGQNPAESVGAGRPTLTGPRMDNFRPLMAALEAEQGIRRLENEAALAPALAELLAKPDLATAMAARGRATLERHRGATRRTVECLAQLS